MVLILNYPKKPYALLGMSWEKPAEQEVSHAESAFLFSAIIYGAFRRFARWYKGTNRDYGRYEEMLGRLEN